MDKTKLKDASDKVIEEFNKYSQEEVEFWGNRENEYWTLMTPDELAKNRPVWFKGDIIVALISDDKYNTFMMESSGDTESRSVCLNADMMRALINLYDLYKKE